MRESKSYMVRAQCGFFSKFFVVDTVKDVEQKFMELEHSCKSVKKLILAGHAQPGNPAAANLNLSNIEDLKPYSCLFEPRAQIQLRGCSAAYGCVGDLFLFSVAKNLLSNGGTIIGPTHGFWTELSGFLGVSINGKYRKLTYDPQKTPPDSWTMTGLTFKDGEPGPKHCATEMTETLNNILKDSKNSQLSTCGLPENSYSYLHPDENSVETHKKVFASLSKNSFSNDSQNQLNQYDNDAKSLSKINLLFDACKPKKLKQKVSTYFDYLLQYDP